MTVYSHISFKLPYPPSPLSVILYALLLLPPFISPSPFFLSCIPYGSILEFLTSIAFKHPVVTSNTVTSLDTLTCQTVLAKFCDFSYFHFICPFHFSPYLPQCQNHSTIILTTKKTFEHICYAKIRGQ